MSKAQWAGCGLLLVLVAVPFSFRGLEVTTYNGWPSLGFATALFLVAGPRGRRQVFVALTVVVSLAMAWNFRAELWQGALGSLAVTLPALLTQRLLRPPGTTQFRLDDVDSGRYHLVTAAGAALCGVLGAVAAGTEVAAREALLAGLMAGVGGLTAQLTVLPLLARTTVTRPAGNHLELWVQRGLLAVVLLFVFWPATRLATGFLVLPVLGWAAVRSTRREAHLQLFLACVTAYVFTLAGRGPFAGPLTGLPTGLSPGLLYLFMAAAAYLTVPLALTVERLVTMTGQARRAATTVERLLDSADGTLIIATDARGLITHFNAGAQQTLGYAPEEVLGRSPAMLHRDEELARQAAHFGTPVDHTAVVLEMVRRGERRDWEFVCRDGSLRMTSLNLSQVTDDDGEVVGYIGSGEDLTDRLRVQGALETALEREHASVQRLEEVDRVKQELVSNVSHELRTPITSIAGYVELLGDSSLGELSDRQAEAIRRIERNVGRLGLLVEDLLLLSRAEHGRLELAQEEVDLRAVVSLAMQTLRDVAAPRPVGMRLTVPDEPMTVSGDADALERVVLNLMSNALKFTPDDGEVHLSVTASSQDRATVTVCDTGVGISAADQEHLFSRFFRASSAVEQAVQGTGLGLSIVHSIVTRHGGTVEVESELGRGTCVTVQLPRVCTGRRTPEALEDADRPATSR